MPLKHFARLINHQVFRRVAPPSGKPPQTARRSHFQSFICDSASLIPREFFFFISSPFPLGPRGLAARVSSERLLHLGLPFPLGRTPSPLMVLFLPLPGRVPGLLVLRGRRGDGLVSVVCVSNPHDKPELRRLKDKGATGALAPGVTRPCISCPVALPCVETG